MSLIVFHASVSIPYGTITRASELEKLTDKNRVSIPYGTITSNCFRQVPPGRIAVSIPYGTITRKLDKAMKMTIDEVSIPYGTITSRHKYRIFQRIYKVFAEFPGVFVERKVVDLQSYKIS